MQYGFVIDHSRCIGCHACTVACKSENDVPIGNFRTWVKYTEQGQFPEVKRSFAVLRCNQCSTAPCISICPVGALDKREDGIVDIDPERCIGCKGCMQACPYDALYINPEEGVAEKCHFCAHRTEQGLAPACAVVCPTEAIIPGDFHDPDSRVSQLKEAGGLSARKTEAGTGPNVLYRDVTEAGIDPSLANAAGGFIWANQTPGVQLDAQQFEALEHKAEARNVYDVEHPPLWGSKVSAYLFTKSIAAGAFLAGALLLPPFDFGAQLGGAALALTAALGLLFLGATTLLLIFDLKRPERFLYILRYANWTSWIAKGTFALVIYGATLSAWLALGLLGAQLPDGATATLGVLTWLSAAFAAAYTAWLFRQAKGRALWMRRGLEISLVVHGVIAGAAVLLLALPLVGVEFSILDTLRWVLCVGIVLQVVLTAAEGHLAPAGREKEYARALRLVRKGPFAGKHRMAIVFGLVVPFAFLVLPLGPIGWAAAAVFALVGLWIEQDVFVRAGQALAIS